jgi:hypothetical protein|uniref:Uncharacterized protein n=1 Tax=candidate division WOR-3 bacterium TaxID=2052148 RepID=A0A7V3RGW4_UNCW3
MKLPKGRPILENTRLEFINLDNVLTASKRERAHRISGYISIIYPDAEEIIFLNQGEPYNAARLSMKERAIIPIAEVIEKAKKATSGILSEYATDEILLNMIITSITNQPIKTGLDLNRLQPKILIDKLKSTKFDGFIWIKAGIEESFIAFKQGELVGLYAAGSAEKIQEENAIVNFLTRPNATISIFDRIETGIPVQATPAQVEMFCKIISALMKNYARPLGNALVLRTVMIAKSTAQKEYPFISEFQIDADFNLSAKLVIEPKLLARGIARWLDLIFESFSTLLGKESDNIAKKVLNDYRFALMSLNFFDYTKIKI